VTPNQRSAALAALAHAQAHAATLHDLLSRCSDVREPEGGTSWRTDVDRARQLLAKSLAEVSRYAIA
jgi:hypothetical protein